MSVNSCIIFWYNDRLDKLFFQDSNYHNCIVLDQTNWHTDGISLNENESLELFKSNYEIVFVDVTGSANLASVLNLSNYLMVYFSHERYCIIPYNTTNDYLNLDKIWK